MVEKHVGSERSPKSIEQMTARELLRKEITTERDEDIKILNIVPEFDLIDDYHADQLGENMKLGRKQLSRVVVRARFDRNSNIVYDIIDGFHRTEGKRRTGDQDIKAVVLYGCSDEELFDQRILAASSVKAVQFPRIAEWVSKSYANTKFARKRIPVERAFYIVAKGIRKPQGINLTDQELNELYEYVAEKCAKWSRTPNVVSDILQVVANADPKLVKKVRDKGGGKDRTNQVTPERLKVVVNAFPGKKNYPIQRALLEMIVEGRMFSTTARFFIEDLQLQLEPWMDSEMIINIAKPVFEKHLASEEKRMGKQSADSRQEGYDNEDEAELDPNSESKKRSGVIYEGSRRKGRPHRTPNKADFFGTTNIEELVKEIEGLKNQIDTLKKQGIDVWWRGTSFLSEAERFVMEEIIYKNEDIQLVSSNLKISTDQAVKLILSALTKRRLNAELT